MSCCGWFSSNDLQREYHEEWGTPLYDDQMQFEYLSMEVMQCGLSFGLILRRRKYLIEHYPTIEKCRYGEKNVQQF